MIDPRQAYLDAIFEPGVFSVADINRALSVRIYSFFDLFLVVNIFKFSV